MDDHVAAAICGLTSDGRSLVEYMRGECLNHKYAFDSPMVSGRLVAQLGEKAHHQSLRIRAYGVGLYAFNFFQLLVHNRVISPFHSRIQLQRKLCQFNQNNNLKWKFKVISQFYFVILSQQRLVGGLDADGPHLYDFSPVGRTYEYEAYAIGQRQQASKTYLEKNFESFKDCTMEELITHAVRFDDSFKVDMDTEINVDEI